MHELLRAAPLARDQVLKLIDSQDFSAIRSEDPADRKLACVLASFLLHLLLTGQGSAQAGAQALVLLRGPFSTKGSFIYLSDAAAVDSGAEKGFLGSQLALRDGVLFNYSVCSQAKKTPIVLGVCLSRVLQNLGSPRFLECLPDPRSACIFLYTQQGSQSAILSIQFSSDKAAKGSQVIVVEAKTASPQPARGCSPSKAGSSLQSKQLQRLHSKKVPRNESSIENLLRLVKATTREASREELVDSRPKLQSESALKDLKASIVSKLRRAKLKTILLGTASHPQKPLLQASETAQPLERLEGSAGSKAEVSSGLASPDSTKRHSFVVLHKPLTRLASKSREEPTTRSSSNRVSPCTFRINKALPSGPEFCPASKRSRDANEGKGGLSPVFARRTPGRQLKTVLVPAPVRPSIRQNDDQSCRSFFFKKRAGQI